MFLWRCFSCSLWEPIRAQLRPPIDFSANSNEALLWRTIEQSSLQGCLLLFSWIPSLKLAQTLHCARVSCIKWVFDNIQECVKGRKKNHSINPWAWKWLVPAVTGVISRRTCTPTNICSRYSFDTVLYCRISQPCISIHRRMKCESKEESVKQITRRGSDVSWLLFWQEKETEAGRGGKMRRRENGGGQCYATRRKRDSSWT